ncbi:ATP-binding cassette domain-containing protein [Segnochrobactrum spirostomi]|uniref:ATP-binding cassette domain-containing protein n=1 Tax=Segnochrobactrum spirostomi TaxID=2608987 RepID=A0A6A7Y1J6_9HYPH|nr:ATP-binding cassette domain-containing protein [Segnochrobactrum spirostomi]MQT12556.1 ATP-binding cassette domain-containing protein [Segnochrobactrum spirostomi]
MSVGHFDWFKKHDTEDELRHKLERLYSVVCGRLALKADPAFIEEALAENPEEAKREPVRRLMRHLLTYKLAMPSGAWGLLGLGLLHSVLLEIGREDGGKPDPIVIQREEARDLAGLARRLQLPEVDKHDIRRAGAFVEYLLRTRGPRGFAKFGRKMGTDGSVEKASRAVTGLSASGLELAWQQSIKATDHEKGPMTLILWVVRASLKHKALLTLFLIANAVQLAYSVKVPVWLQDLFNNGIEKNNISVIQHYITLLSVGFLFASGFGVLLDYTVAKLGPRIMNDIRERMFVKVNNIDGRVLALADTDEIVADFTNDLTVLEKAVIWAIPNLFSKALVLIGSVYVAFTLDTRLAIATLASLIVAFWLPRSFSRRAVRYNYERGSEDAKVSHIVKENLLMQRIIRMFGLRELQSKVFSDQMRKLFRASYHQYFSSNLVGRITNFGVSAAQLIVIGLGAVQSVEGQVSPGTIVAFITLLLTIGGAAGFIGAQLPLVIQGVGGLARVDSLLDKPDAAPEPKNPETLDGPVRSVRFENVNFSYDDTTPALTDVSFSVECPKHVMIVGPSGSGKTTVLRMIENQFAPSGGHIRINGIDTRLLGETQLRSLLSLVPQETILFQGSVRENIRMGKLDATEEEIIAAAKEAEMHEIILSLSDGYDTDVGESGNKLSGGQRQRIAIARALLRDPQILLLDEATSALDAASRTAIEKTLAKVTEGRTVFWVTHDPTQCANADIVIVVKAGHLAEIGTHAELLAANGVYADLWEKTVIASGDAAVSREQLIERILRRPVMRNVPPVFVETLVSRMQVEMVSAGTPITIEGQRSDKLAIITQGEALQSVHLADGTLQPITVYEIADFVGETAALADATELTQIVARTSCRLLSIDRDALRKVFDEYPEISNRIIADLGSRYETLGKQFAWQKLHGPEPV